VPVTALIEIIATLDSIPLADVVSDVGPTIFARRPWTPDSDAVVLREHAVNHVAPSAPDHRYLLEVDLAREVIEVWSDWRGGAQPTPAQAAQAVIHYAEHDAHQPVD
jgi:hypothetical protein